MVILSPCTVVVHFFACILTTKYAYADTSLFVPGFDEKPLSVSELGAGADGRTTWQLVGGKPTGGFTQVDFPATATLIEGSSDAVVYYSLTEVEYYASYSCSIGANGIADCGGVIANPTETSTVVGILETVSSFLVEGGATSSPTTPSTTSLPVKSSTSSTGSPSSSISRSPSSGTNTADTPAGSGNSNCAGRIGSCVAVGVIVGLVGLVLG